MAIDKKNILMISIGDNILSNPVGDALDRQKEYAKSLGYIDMIVFSPKQHNLETKYFENLSIYPTKSFNMITFVYDVLKITKEILKSKTIDIITTQDPFGTALAGYFIKNRYNIPLHIQNHSCFLDNELWIEEKPILFKLFNRLSKFTLKKANRLRVVNHTEKQKYIDILGIEEDKIDVAPVPTNISFWQDIPIQEDIDKFLSKYNFDICNHILSWAGRIVQVKNFPYLFKSVSLIKEKQKVTFLIAGDIKTSFWNLKELEKQYNIKPVYLGLLTHKELKMLYYITNIYLHTSNYEGFGLVVLDAQACGTAVVSRYTAGTSDIVDDGKSGYLINGDEKEFSKTVLKLLNDKKCLIDMSKYSIDMIRNKFNKCSMFNNVIKSIKDSK